MGWVSAGYVSLGPISILAHVSIHSLLTTGQATPRPSSVCVSSNELLVTVSQTQTQTWANAVIVDLKLAFKYYEQTDPNIAIGRW